MDQNKILTKARKVLSNNKGYQEAIKVWTEDGSEFESVEELIMIVGDQVVMSNEGSIPLTGNTCELLYGLFEDFKKAGLFVEPYDAGTFIIYWEGN